MWLKLTQKTDNLLKCTITYVQFLKRCFCRKVYVYISTKQNLKFQGLNKQIFLKEQTQGMYVASNLDTQIHYVHMLEFKTKTMQLHGLSKALAQYVHFTSCRVRVTHTKNNKLTT